MIDAWSRCRPASGRRFIYSHIDKYYTVFFLFKYQHELDKGTWVNMWNKAHFSCQCNEYGVYRLLQTGPQTRRLTQCTGTAHAGRKCVTPGKATSKTVLEVEDRIMWPQSPAVLAFGLMQQKIWGTGQRTTTELKLLCGPVFKSNDLYNVNCVVASYYWHWNICSAN